MAQLSFHSPVGDLTVSEEGGALVSVDWGWGRDQEETSLLRKTRKQIEAYLDGKRQDFDLPLRPIGTAFQLRVWKAMQKIPFGKVHTYGALAKRIKSGPRPVGTACGANPLPIIIPCHRVILANGGVGGYSGEGGLDTKRTLLALEGYNTDLF
jgi:methylated-DNA-[protein]-cysteine S-methyltransferase